MQSQIVCGGCRSILLYPRGASNVCCALCNAITTVPPPGTEMAQLICGGCRTLLMYTRGATSVRCSCCHTVNLAPASNQVAHINCGNCRTTLMYPFGAPSVKCAVCHYITNVNIGNGRVPIPANRPNETAAPASMPSTSLALPHSHTQTVVVENPMSVDESGKLIGNGRVPIPANRPNETAAPASMPSTSLALPHSHTQTVVVENPMSVDESGKLVSNVVVGVTTEKKAFQ